jgi:hypothetical protein
MDQAEPILQFFRYGHLPASLQAISAPFYSVAHWLVETAPQNAERSAALRKLLEAKDCAVRATMPKGIGDAPMFGLVSTKQLDFAIAGLNSQIALFQRSIELRLGDLAAAHAAQADVLAAIQNQGKIIMSQQDDLKASVAALAAAAATLISAETTAIANANAAGANDPVIAASIANINEVTGNLTSAAAALSPTAAPVAPADAQAQLAPANPAPAVDPNAPGNQTQP